jgi:hypothetical protein
MATAAEIKSFIDEALADNVSRDITPEVMRDTLSELVDWTIEYNPAWTSKGAWSSATAYVLNDYVTFGGSSFRCKAAHTNQAVSNGTYWELVAEKGLPGDQRRFYADSVFDGDSLSLFVTSGTDGGLDVKTKTSTGYDFAASSFKLKKDSLYYVDMEFKGTGTFALVLYNTVALSTTVISFGEAIPGTFTKRRFYFKSTTAESCTLGLSLITGSVLSYKYVVLKEQPLGETAPSDLAFMNNGQLVYDVANAAKIGMYVNSIVGIVWLNKEVIPLAPNGTSISMVINRPYKFTWALLYNDGVTTVTLPATTINANANATFVLTGAAGKTYSIVIYPSV